MRARDLAATAARVRAHVLRVAAAPGGCHVGGPLSAADLFVGLYFADVFRYRPQEPNWSERDRFVLSCGHYAPAWYAVLAEAGYFSLDQLATIRTDGSRLQGHPSRRHADFVEVSTGSLGQGLSVGLGMALGLRFDQSPARVWVMASDAEFQEGQTWEAVQAAGAFRPGNLQLIVDVNGIQIDGLIREIMPVGDLKRKLRLFGWEVLTVDGHSFPSIVKAYRRAVQAARGPTAILARTIAGKGVSFMEGKPEWHDGYVAPDQLEAALKEVGDGA